MQQEGNSAPDAKRPTVEGPPVITLFGKRMPMEPEPHAPGRREDFSGYDSSGERRVFWLITILFLAILGGVAAGVYFLAVRGSSGRGTAVTRPAGKPAAPGKPAASGGQLAPPAAPQPATQAPPGSAPASTQAPPPAPTAAAPTGATPVQPPSRKQDEGARARSEAASPSPAGESRRAKAKAQRRPAENKPSAQSKARAAADKVTSAQKEYLQRLREQKEQYERDRARGKYQEFPK